MPDPKPARTRRSGLGAAMAGGNPDPARGRSEGDFYATPDDVTTSLLAYLGTRVNGVVWEPCGGDGRMAKLLHAHPGVQAVLATDIAPRPAAEQVFKVGVLDVFNVTALPDRRRFDTIITNPPFAIAERIIRHIFDTAEPRVRTVALLLKGSYWHASRRAPLFRQHPPSLILPLSWRPDFFSLGAPTLELAWNVWLAHPPGTDRPPTIYDLLPRVKPAEEPTP